MNRSEAIKELVKGGKRAEAKKAISTRSASAARVYDEIRNDPTYSDTHKAKLLAARYAGINRELTDELARMAQSVTTADRGDAARVFGVEGLPGDAASLAISRRDAGDRVAAISDSSELAALLRRATRTGDEVLARAIAERGTELQAPDVLHLFLESRPELDQSVERLWNAQRAESGSAFDVTAELAGLRPAELHGMSSESIDKLADEARQGEPAAAAAGAVSTGVRTGSGGYFSGTGHGTSW